MRTRTLVLMLAAALTACATAPTGRKQFIMISDGEMSRMGAAAFDQVKTTKKLSTDTRTQTYVRCVADSLVAQMPETWRRQPWEVVVFEDATPNAFALPGGKIGVNSGMLTVADTPDQLAAVIGHELGHVQSKHGAERVSQQFAAQAAMAAVQVYQSTQRSGDSGTVMGLLGIGATLGVLLPYSRLHEREADQLGQKLMARAGYDPNAAATLWQDMQQRESTRLPQFLSTHPDPANRAKAMTERAPSLQADFDAARAAGLGQTCRG